MNGEIVNSFNCLGIFLAETELCKCVKMRVVEVLKSAMVTEFGWEEGDVLKCGGANDVWN